MSLSFLNQLPDLVLGNLLTFLSVEEWLNLRLVSQKLKNSLNKKVNHSRFKEIFILISDIGFLDTYCASEFHIPNIQMSQYLNQQNNLEQFASKITRIHVEHCWGFKEDEEFKFFSSFINLKEIVLRNLILQDMDGSCTLRCPSNFKKLTIFKIHSVVHINSNQIQNEDKVWKLLKISNQTESLDIPNMFSNDSIKISEYYQRVWEPIMIILRERNSLLNDKKHNNIRSIPIKEINLKTIWHLYQKDVKQDNKDGYQEFFQFLKFCYLNKIKIKNILGEFINEINEGMDTNKKTMSTFVNKTIHSLIGFPSCYKDFDWDFLKSLKLWTDDFVPIIQSDNDKKFSLTPIMTNLESLYVNCNSKKINLHHLDHLMTLFFPKNIYLIFPRTRLTKLIIDFNSTWNDSKNQIDITHIVKMVPNLQCLKIMNADWKDADTWESMFIGLTSLQELWIENCFGFSDYTILGEDHKNPHILHLKKLTKLSLINLDKMTGVTNLAFIQGFSRIPLVEFYIKNWERYLTNVSSQGIAALGKGPCGESLTKFLFEGHNSKNKFFTIKDVRKFK